MPNVNNEAVRYLDDSGFFLHYAARRLSPGSRRRATMVPLSLVTYAESYNWLKTTLTAWLAGRLRLRPASLGLLEVCLGEVFNNIRDHSGVHKGAVLAQQYPKKQIVRVAVSDFGEGIPAIVRTKEPFLTDTACVRRAMEPGFTTRSSPGNRGAGLDILADSVLQINRSHLTILSGRCALTTSPGETEAAFHTREVQASYPGTLQRYAVKVIRHERLPEVSRVVLWLGSRLIPAASRCSLGGAAKLPCQSYRVAL